MNCQEANQMFDLRVDNALDAATARSLDDHLQCCASCRAAYQVVEAESGLLRHAFQADLSSAAEMARIEARVLEATRLAGSAIPGIAEWLMLALGTLLGFLVLVWGRFDGAAVREAICLSLNPPAGLRIAIPSAVVAVWAVLAAVAVQPLMLRLGLYRSSPRE